MTDRLKNKVKEQTLIIKRCPLCISSINSDFRAGYLYGIKINYRVCHSCGFIFQSPTYTNEEWNYFYKNEYRKLYDNNLSPTERQINLQEKRASAYLGFIKEFNKNFTSEFHVDIGSSTGIFLRELKKYFRVKRISGIELSHEYREFSNNNNIPTYESLDGLQNECKINSISMFNVLEHLPRPVEYLSDIVEKQLSNDGMVFIEVPNIEGGAGMELAHMHLFTPSTLRATFLKAGLKIIFLKLHGKPRSHKLNENRYIFAIAKKSHDQQYIVLKNSNFLKRLLTKLLSYKYEKYSWSSFFLRLPFIGINYVFKKYIRIIKKK